MALIKCKECGSMVSNKAGACPSCGAKPRKSIGTFSGLIIIGMAVWFFAKVFGGGSSSTVANSQVDKCDDPTMAFVMSQNFVKKNLKSPSTADFPYINNDGVRVSKISDCNYQVIGYVDSQNGFGAMVRSSYSVNMESTTDGKKWTARNLIIK
jgi:hypothetical protein